MTHAQTTPVPNVLFDVYLKDLKCAELKVLLVIIRQTLGWIDSRAQLGRKEKDWISGSQLQSKTGSSRRAISSAIEALVDKRLIVVSDGSQTLNNAKDRKGRPRLYFRLSSTPICPVDHLWITGGNPCTTGFPNAKFAQGLSKNVTGLAQKMRITKETLQN